MKRLLPKPRRCGLRNMNVQIFNLRFIRRSIEATARLRAGHRESNDRHAKEFRGLHNERFSTSPHRCLLGDFVTDLYHREESAVFSREDLIVPRLVSMWRYF